MKKNIISIILLLTTTILSAQTEITRSAISSVGYTSTVGTTKLLYTAGELAVNENTQGTVHISEGFINPNLAIVTGLSGYSENKINVSVFPNPANDFVNIQFSNIQKYEINLYSIDGKIIATYITNSNIEQIPLNNLSNGEYLLIIKNQDNNTYKTFKLVKK